VRLFRAFDTTRLIPTRFVDREDSVLAALADDDPHLRDIFDLDNATNARIRTQAGDVRGAIGPDELISGVPCFRIVNAAFVYANPSGSRFNGPRRGAWYCSLERDTALAEVIHHKTLEYAEIGRFDDSVSYRVFLADFSAQLHRIDQGDDYREMLSPDSYVASQSLGQRLLEAGSLGLVFPSVRKRGGTNVACFRPTAVGNVRAGQLCRLEWRGSLEPAVSWLAEEASG
jgi:RES domain-containing protein